jgi:CTP:molybdopterin cytidylyltransferase MocA
LVGVVLAAGGSTRFAAGPKQLAEAGGRALVRLAAEAAVGAECFDEVLVVQGAVDCRPVLDDLSVTVVDNPRWADGMATSLQVGVAEAGRRGAAAVVVGLADQPGVGPDDWRTVALSPSVAPVVVATYGGRRGNPVRLDRSVWDELPVEGDEGARALMARRSDLVTAVACPGDAADVDTVEDLERWN